MAHTVIQGLNGQFGAMIAGVSLADLKSPSFRTNPCRYGTLTACLRCAATNWLISHQPSWSTGRPYLVWWKRSRNQAATR